MGVWTESAQHDLLDNEQKYYDSTTTIKQQHVHSCSAPIRHLKNSHDGQS